MRISYKVSLTRAPEFPRKWTILLSYVAEELQELYRSIVSQVQKPRSTVYMYVLPTELMEFHLCNVEFQYPN